VLEDASNDTDMLSLRQQVNQLQAELSKTTKSLEGLAANAGSVQKVPPGGAQSKQNFGASNRSQGPAGSSGSKQEPTSDGGHLPRTPSGRGRGGWGRGHGLHRPAQGSDACRSCGETGHWAKDCPKRPPGNQAVTGTVSSRAVNRVHVMAEIQGSRSVAFLPADATGELLDGAVCRVQGLIRRRMSCSQRTRLH